MKPTHTLIALLLFGCADATPEPGAEPAAGDLADRAYVVSEGSDELFVFDAATLTEIGSVDTQLGEIVNANHMAVVRPDATKVYVAASHADAMVVVDAASLEVTDVVEVGAHNSHASFRPDTDELWVVNEDDDSVSIIDTSIDEVIARIEDISFVVPHNVRFSPDGERAYVPSIGGNQISVVDLDALAVVDVLVPEGLEMGACAGDPCGFADAQIDDEGVMYAAHIESGQVFVYDTIARTTLGQVAVGAQPWAAFVDVGDVSPAAWMVPNFGDETVSVIARDTLSASTVHEGDAESYGVNYSALTPDQAFVLNRTRERVAVLDAATGALIDAVDVGGTTETATTTPDGRYILLPLSSADALAVLDVQTREVVARFEDIGDYPWSVAMASGQNYCH